MKKSHFKNKQQILSQANSLSNLENIYFAEKQIQGDTWYCLISKTYENKKKAQAALTSSGQTAWLVERALFKTVTLVN